MQIEDYEQQIIELQAKAAYQEDLLQSLSQMVADQDKVIRRLDSQVKRWESRLDDMAYTIESGSSTGTEPPPPHY